MYNYSQNTVIVSEVIANHKGDQFMHVLYVLRYIIG